MHNILIYTVSFKKIHRETKRTKINVTSDKYKTKF